MASLPLACKLTTPSSNLKQNPKIISNPTSALFNILSNTRTNKSANLIGFKVSAKANASVGVTTVRKKMPGYSDEVAEEVKAARKTRDEQWEMALETLLAQIKAIRRKIDTHFIDQPEVANPMLVILEDVKSLVEIHKVNIGLKNPIPTTDAMMTIASHFQAYKHSETEDGVIPVDPRPKRTPFSPMIDMFTEVANLLYGQRGAQLYLQGYYAPVREETPPTEIKVVEGELPSCIKGMLIRNGPNPQFEPLAKYQWLDGDGMLHATYFQDGKVTYASRYTKTSRFKQESITGQSKFPKYGDYTGAFGVFTAFTQLLKSVFVLDTSYGCGVANENIVYRAGLLVALEDFDRPFVLYGCKMAPEEAENDSIPVIKSVHLCRALVGENVTLTLPELYKFTFDLKTGEATQERVSENKIDYTKINENLSS